MVHFNFLGAFRNLWATDPKDTLVIRSLSLVDLPIMGHHNLTKRYSELKRFAKINPRQTSSLSLFPKCSMCISINN